MNKRAETLILNHDEILQKITRIAWQILENNHEAKTLVLIGIEKGGSLVSGLICDSLNQISSLEIHQGSVSVNKENPTIADISLHCEVDLEDCHVVLVDDVLNSGKTLMYSAIPILAQNPRQLQTGVLANRDHIRFPIKADFVGISLATTLQEHIRFMQDDNGKMSVYLI
jgi:pyrimidine operon attenuation protein / uracil phosphoribosyltransferase